MNRRRFAIMLQIASMNLAEFADRIRRDLPR
jgi:hypothetical protein